MLGQQQCDRGREPEQRRNRPPDSPERREHERRRSQDQQRVHAQVVPHEAEVVHQALMCAAPRREVKGDDLGVERGPARHEWQQHDDQRRHCPTGAVRQQAPRLSRRRRQLGAWGRAQFPPIGHEQASQQRLRQIERHRHHRHHIPQLGEHAQPQRDPAGGRQQPATPEGGARGVQRQGNGSERPCQGWDLGLEGNRASDVERVQRQQQARRESRPAPSDGRAGKIDGDDAGERKDHDCQPCGRQRLAKEHIQRIEREQEKWRLRAKYRAE